MFSFVDIRLDWQSYIAEKEDDQIIDLLVMIGNPFPLLDDDENEIEYEDDVTMPLIKVKLNPHQGKLSSIPFTMAPRQMVTFLFCEARANFARQRFGFPRREC